MRRSKVELRGVAALVLTTALVVLGPDVAIAERTVWSQAKLPAAGTAAAIGTYTAGCVRGADRLPLSGPGYQVMRPSRRRFFGHPELISVVQNLGKAMRDKGLGPILVGDLGQAMGGPAPRGHASHQSGLDVDVWFWHPKVAERRLLSKRERSTTPAHRVVDPKKFEFTKYWSDEVPEMIWQAARDSRVSRVLVNPLIKKKMCEEPGQNKGLLRKVRPWYGHADHMHVRLHCPTGSKHCVPQDEIPEGDGCSELDWWLNKKATRARKQGKAEYLKTVGAVPPLPEQCMALVEPSEDRASRRRSTIRRRRR